MKINEAKPRVKTKDKIKMFFKKIYYSLFKVDKYPEMVSEGVKKAAVYIRNIIFILGAVYATILAIYGMQNLQKLAKHLDELLPNISYEEGKLAQDNGERVIIDDEIINEYTGHIIVVDTFLDIEAIKEEFKNEAKPTLFFAAEECLKINEKSEIQEFQYESLFSNYSKQTKSEVDKNTIINLIGNVQYPSYFLRLAFSYLIVSFIYIFGYCLLTSVFLYIYYKRDNIFKFSEIFTICLYASTILTLGFLLISLMPATIGAITEILLFIITFGYEIRGINYIKKTRKKANKKNK